MVTLSQIIKAYTAVIRTAHKNRHLRSAETQNLVDRFQIAAGAMVLAVAEDILRAQTTPNKRKENNTMVKKPAKDTYAKPVKEGKAVNLKPMKPGKKSC